MEIEKAESSECADKGAAARSFTRMEKSLAASTHRFIALCVANASDSDIIDLRKASEALGVNRRRIYDIVNILETIGITSRSAKNSYRWFGHEAMPRSRDEWRTHFQNPLLAPRRAASLGTLCERFIQLLLERTSEQDGAVSLEEAGEQLSSEEDSDQNTSLRTCARRLYDIANVLVIVGLVQKISRRKERRPLFRWIQEILSAPCSPIPTAREKQASPPPSVDREFLFSTPAAPKHPHMLLEKPSMSAFRALSSKYGPLSAPPPCIVSYTDRDKAHFKRLMQPEICKNDSFLDRYRESCRA